MDFNIILICFVSALGGAVLAYFFVNKKFNQQIPGYKSVSEALQKTQLALSNAQDQHKQTKSELQNLNKLLELTKKYGSILDAIKDKKLNLANLISENDMVEIKIVGNTNTLKHLEGEASEVQESIINSREELQVLHNNLKDAKTEMGGYQEYKSIFSATEALKVNLQDIRILVENEQEQLNELKDATAGIQQYKTIFAAIQTNQARLANIKQEIEKGSDQLKNLSVESKELQQLKTNAESIFIEFKNKSEQLESIRVETKELKNSIKSQTEELHELMAKLDLYSRIDEFTDSGLFETPNYLYETSARFSEEIKRIRKKQKVLISEKSAVEYQNPVNISDDEKLDKKIIDGQIKLMLTAFNIECDLLIEQVNPSNFPRILERIEVLATNLEKYATTLYCGFNIDYVELKYEECRLQYHHKLKKKEEQEEQLLIREQIRQEQKIIKEYEREIAQAEKEERMYRDMLDRARKELGKATSDERIIAEQRIADLERQLSEAEYKQERAKSMAEQTRKGHVYIVSNIGSFGENIYKIGLTRRLEPLDRVKELGGASVPFPFDVHAMIYADDAPKLETDLHRLFTTSRVNAINLRKEFFRIDLQSIKSAVESLAGDDIEFKTTIMAEDYFESRRLQGSTFSRLPNDR